MARGFRMNDEATPIVIRLTSEVPIVEDKDATKPMIVVAVELAGQMMLEQYDSKGAAEATFTHQGQEFRFQTHPVAESDEP